MSEWISVESELPDNEAYVLVNIPFKFMDDSMLEVSGTTILTLMYFDNQDGKCWFDDRSGNEQEYASVSHWMPLPEPPK